MEEQFYGQEPYPQVKTSGTVTPEWKIKRVNTSKF